MRSFIFILLLFLNCSLFAGTYYVTPRGNDTNDGSDTTSANAWLTWRHAFSTADAGDTVYFRGGVYYSESELLHPRIDPYGYEYAATGHTGTEANPICFFAYPSDFAVGNYPILDCRLVEPYLGGSLMHGISFWFVQYIELKGLTIRNMYQRGLVNLPCGITLNLTANFKFTDMTIHDVSGRGVWGSTITGHVDPPDMPADYTVLCDTTTWMNCDFYNLCDSTSANPGNAADGIKVNLNQRTSVIYPHPYWYLYGCRFWNFSDDGTDIGGTGIVIHENCWSSSTDKYSSLYVEGNGFKSGGLLFNTIPADSLLTINWRLFNNCIAAFNDGDGFYDLDYWPYFRTNALFYNNIAYKDSTGFYATNNVSYRPRTSTYKNNIAYGNLTYTNATYLNVQIGANDDQTYPESHNTWDAYDPTPGSWPFFLTADTTLTDGVPHPIEVTDADFISLDGTELFLPRKSDNSLPDIGFLKLAPLSDLIDAGIDVGLDYSGDAPDLGYFESTVHHIYNPYQAINFDIYYKSNLHSHSTESDGGYTASQVIGLYSTPDADPLSGYSILAITDHDSYPHDTDSATTWAWSDFRAETPSVIYSNGAMEIAAKYPTLFRNNGMLAIRGNELSNGSDANHHVSSLLSDLGYSYHVELTPYDTFYVNIQKRNGLAVFNHPGRYNSPAFYYNDLLADYYGTIVGIEVFNYGNYAPVQNPIVLWDSINKTRSADSLLWGFSGADFHGTKPYENYNFHYMDSLAYTEFRESIENGAFTFSYEASGDGKAEVPILTGVTTSGDSTITITGSGVTSIAWYDNTGGIIDNDAKVNISSSSSNYVRAVLTNAAGVTYTQPFGIEIYSVDSTATDILTFILPEQTGSAIIDITAHTVSIEVTWDANVTDLTPIITMSYGATIAPLSGVSQDFTSSVVYTVTAMDEVTTQEWTVTVTKETQPNNGFIVKYRGKIVKR